MKDKELRKLIGSRVKQRRLELNLTQPYVAEKMGVTASTILRYENGSIDNTKKMVLEGLSSDYFDCVMNDAKSLKNDLQSERNASDCIA